MPAREEQNSGKPNQIVQSHLFFTS